MSGGVAFLYDPERTVGERVNDEMVDVEPLTPEDAQWLREVLATHRHETGSMVAERILASEGALGDFVKIMPRDYRRVLKTIADAEREGRDVNEAIMEASHG